MDGSEQVVINPAARWGATMTIPLRSDDAILELRALTLDGRAAELLIGPYDQRRAPWGTEPITGLAITPGRRERAITVYPDYVGMPAVTGLPTFALAQNAALNATQITVTRARGGLLRRGMFFSIGDRLHAIRSISGENGGAGPIDLTIRPWLLDDYGAGTALNFVDPRCVMRPATDDTARAALELMRFGTTTLDLVEAR